MLINQELNITRKIQLIIYESEYMHLTLFSFLRVAYCNELAH
jgi:hypothetical protein